MYTRNDVTGLLTPVAGSPFPSREAVTSIALDFTGRYLFTTNRATSKISMFTIDPITGALQEVPNSPFASISLRRSVDGDSRRDSRDEPHCSTGNLQPAARDWTRGPAECRFFVLWQLIPWTNKRCLTLTITSNGGQALRLNSLTITGLNSADFAKTDTCHVPMALPPGQSCSVLLTFSPWELAAVPQHSLSRTMLPHQRNRFP